MCQLHRAMMMVVMAMAVIMIMVLMLVSLKGIVIMRQDRFFGGQIYARLMDHKWIRYNRNLSTRSYILFCSIRQYSYVYPSKHLS